MAQFLELKKGRLLLVVKEQAESEGMHPGEERRRHVKRHYPRKDDNRPHTLLRRPDEIYPCPYDKNQRGGYRRREGFRVGRGRGRSVHFGDRRGLYVTGTVEEQQENDMIPTPRHDCEPEPVLEQPQPAWLQRADEKGASKNKLRQLRLSQVSCRDPRSVRHQRAKETYYPPGDTATQTMDDEEFEKPRVLRNGIPMTFRRHPNPTSR